MHYEVVGIYSLVWGSEWGGGGGGVYYIAHFPKNLYLEVIVDIKNFFCSFMRDKFLALRRTIIRVKRSCHFIGVSFCKEKTIIKCLIYFICIH